MNKKLLIASLMFSSFALQALPCIITFVNQSNVNMDLQMTFSDGEIKTKTITPHQSYQAVNRLDEFITSIACSSQEKDKKGNLYGQLTQQIEKPTSDTTYVLTLKVVPAHKVDAVNDTPAFQMPETQTIVCNILGKAPVTK